MALSTPTTIPQIDDAAIVSIKAGRFLCGPGVGKGAQCARVAKKFDFHHICVGDLLRGEAKSPTSPYRDFIPESIDKSVLLPAQVTTMLLKRKRGEPKQTGQEGSF